MGAGRRVEKEGEVEVKVEATRCRDIGVIPMVATRARWRVDSCFRSGSCSDCDCDSEGWGEDSAGEKVGSEGVGWSSEALEGAGEMGNMGAGVRVLEDGWAGAEAGAGGEVGVGERERPCAVRAFMTTSQPFSRDLIRSLSS